MSKQLIFLFISVLLVLPQITFGQNNEMKSKLLYLKGIDSFDKNDNKKADSLFTASLEAYLNSDACYSLALIKLRLEDTCNYCHNLKKASLLGDDLSTEYYKKVCSGYAEKLTQFYKNVDSIYSLKVKTNPNSNTYFDLAVSKAKLGQQCLFCENLENPYLSFIPEIKKVIEKKCYSAQTIQVQDSIHNGNKAFNIFTKGLCNNQKSYTYVETNSDKETVFKYTTSEIQNGRIMKIEVKEISNDSSEYSLYIDTTKVGTKDEALYVVTRINVKAPNETVYTMVELMPSFRGGEMEMYDFLSDNIKYPQEAKETGISGNVIITYVIEKDGSVTGVQVLKDIGGGCGEEAVRVVKAMPKWNPGKQKGIPVRVQFILPIRFSME
jgi:TonB family protein